MRRRVFWASLCAALIASTTPFPAVRIEPAQSQPILAVPTTEALARPGAPVLNSAGVYVPPARGADQQRVLLALHGQGGTGPGIAQRLRTCAERYGWVLVAPTMAYRDFLDPEQVRRDGEENLPAVHTLVDDIRSRAGGVTSEQILVYGFSRGAQMAHRFAMAYPQEVLAVAALSAGSYTMPRDEDQSQAPLEYPFGVADLESVTGEAFDEAKFVEIPFWLGVGAADTNPLDIGRAWDNYEGQTRVDRAAAFATQLQAEGAQAELHLFSGVGHEETSAMRADACAFLDARSHPG